MLKQLRLSKELELKRSKLQEYLSKEEGFKKRSADLAASLEEAKTEEDVTLVSEEIDKLDAEQKEVEENKSSLEEEIEALSNELEEIEERSKQPKKQQTRSKGVNAMNKLQVRELLKSGEYYERSEVKEFYDKFRNLRSVTGGELTIPHVVVSRIMDIVGDYTTVYPLVDKMQVKGTSRILVDTDTNEATWLEMNGAFTASDVGTITNVDFDGFKVGKVTFVDNYLLQDSIINLDQYVSKKLARSISKALDLAILHGTGEKQPLGIITELEKNHGGRVVTVANPTGYADIVKPIALVDNGKDVTGGVVAVMSRATYYNRCMQYTVQTNQAGSVVGKLPNLANPDMLGLPVVFSNYMKDDEILFGDFSKYTLVERETITVESSTHVRFSEDQTGFRGKGRFDGKPTNAEGFVLVKITADPTFIGGNTVPGGTTPVTPTPGGDQGGTTPDQGGTTPTPETEFRAVTANDIIRNAQNTQTYTIGTDGSIESATALSYTNNGNKSGFLLPADVTEMTFKLVDDIQRWMVIGADQDENNTTIIGIGKNALYNIANAPLVTAGNISGVISKPVFNSDPYVRSFDGTYSTSLTVKVINSDTQTKFQFATDVNPDTFVDWYYLDKSKLPSTAPARSPRLGFVAGITSGETSANITKFVKDLKIKKA